MTTRALTPICGAAMPAPLKARMVSSMSVTSAASSASKRVTGPATSRSNGSPIFSTRRTAIAGRPPRGCRGPRLFGPRHRLRHQMMVRRQIAHRVGIVGVTGQQVRLAAATAEVPGSFRTAATGLLHPRLAAKTVEGRRVIPDGADVRLTHIGELQSRQHARRVTGQAGTAGRDPDKYLPQAAHAGLGPGLEVVRHHEIDLHPAADALAEAPRGLLRPLELRTAGEQVLAVETRPAVKMRVGELDVLRAHTLGHIQVLA